MRFRRGAEPPDAHKHQGARNILAAAGDNVTRAQGCVCGGGVPGRAQLLGFEGEMWGVGRMADMGVSWSDVIDD